MSVLVSGEFVLFVLKFRPDVHFKKIVKFLLWHISVGTFSTYC